MSKNYIMSKVDIYFSLSVNQRKKFHSLGYNSYLDLLYIPMSEFLKITKDNCLIRSLINIKRQSLQLVG